MLFKVDSQQWFETDCIEIIDDSGYDLNVTLKTGRVIRVYGSDRQRFFLAAFLKETLALQQS